MSPPWLLHEDEDLLAVCKPAGVNTHRPATDGQAGIHEWVQLARGEELAVLHRLDKATSGVLLFGRSRRANQALTAQLSERQVEKRYLLLVPADPRRQARLRCDERVRKKPRRKGEERVEAETEFERVEVGAGWELVEARPHTGRTHQIRVHAARLGMPIVGDREYGGVVAARLFLHAASIRVAHPDGSGPLTLSASLPQSFRQVLEGAPPHAPPVALQAALEARRALLDPADTDAFLWIDRHHDGLQGARVERLGGVAHVLRYDDAEPALPAPWLEALRSSPGVEAVVLRRRPAKGDPGRQAAGCQVLAGQLESPRFEVRELGLRYLLDLEASATSTGLFLDQRDTRARLLGMDLGGQKLLNAFAHTGSLSVAAARAGAWTQTLDLSKRYLDWARENFALNGLDPAEHDFVYGDALEWLRRFERQGRRFHGLLLDPPSFSRSGKGRKSKTWSVERDLGQLVERGVRLLEPDGWLYVSTNLRRLDPRQFERRVQEGLAAAGRTGTVELSSLPLDHRCGPQDPPYLKGAWVRVGRAGARA